MWHDFPNAQLNSPDDFNYLLEPKVAIFFTYLCCSMDSASISAFCIYLSATAFIRLFVC